MSVQINDIDPSVFIEAGVDVTTHTGERIVPLPMGESATSLLYCATIDGKMVFMKRLRPNLLSSVQYRLLYRKEYEVGSRLSHPNIVSKIRRLTSTRILSRIRGSSLSPSRVSAIAR